MNGLTKFVLKRPVTCLMGLLCLAVFGFTSVKNSRMELTPEMNQPILMVMTTYTGAQPGDVDTLISQKIESAAGSLSGVKKISSASSEGRSTVTIQYEYGTDLDKAYDDLKKEIDAVTPDLPSEADEPVVLELDTSSSADMTLVVSREGESNQYGYVNSEIVPEFEKLADAAEVSVAGGSEDFIRVELITEQMNQYGLSLSSIAADIASAGAEVPGGNVDVGKKKAAISTRLNFDTEESLKDIPLTVSDGSIVYLSAVANIYTTQDEEGSVAHYNGEPAVTLSVSKQQSSTAADLSKEVKSTVRALTAADPKLSIHIVNDSADDIRSSLLSIAETIFLAMTISMAVIWLFFGDLKASLIVGSSIPVSILSALILMNRMDFSLNMLTLAALSLGVGMMVDNSVVVLESCFRVTEQEKENSNIIDYFHDALKGTGIVSASVLGGTLTTCVVFLPLAFLGGMAGQMFKPLGFTIVFCVGASLISAITVVPLCYMLYRPTEKKAPLSAPIDRLQDCYRSVMRTLLPRKKTVMGVSVLLLVFSLFLAMQLHVTLLSADDQGQISVTVEMAPGLKAAEVDRVLRKVEQAFSDYEELESYVASYGGSGSDSSNSAEIMIYLSDKRKTSTKDTVELFRERFADVTDCSITVEENTIAGSMSDDGYELILKGTDYDEVKAVSDEVRAELMKRPELTRVHSSLENAAPVVEVTVDAILARHAGISPGSVGSSVYEGINGKTAAELEVNGNDVDVKVQYPPDEFRTVDQIRQMMLPGSSGTWSALADIAEVSFQDSPSTINREDKQYVVTLSADYTEAAGKNPDQAIFAESVQPHLTATVNQGTSSLDETTREEMTNLLYAILLAVFLVFVVMAAQFESPRFSFMVMTTIPFSLIGSFGLMFILDCDLGMAVLLGFVMLIGTVVNSGILYVDTVNQYREEMDLETALIEAGATRLRPILMTTLTTILSMIPMAAAWGHSGEMLQGLAVANVGGLAASTVLSLLMLPVYYTIMQKKPKHIKKQREE